MFRKINKKDEKVKGVSSNNYGKLLYDLVLINKKIKKLEFLGNSVYTKDSLNGNVYQGNGQFSISEINDVESVLKRVDIIDMIYFYGITKDVQVYQHEYVGHFLSSNFIEVYFKNGNTKKIFFA